MFIIKLSKSIFYYNSHLLLKPKELNFSEIVSDDYDFLYELLNERESWMNISHKKIPTFEEHINFVQNHPYEKWYIININNNKVGSVYLTKINEVGIFIKKRFQRLGIGKMVLKHLFELHPKDRYLANINPNNIESIKFFEHNNFKLIQNTYELIRSK